MSNKMVDKITMKKVLALFLLLLSLMVKAQNYSAFIGDNKKYGYKDSIGSIVIPPKYDFASNFSENRGIVYQNKKYGSIDEKGIEIIPIKYEDASRQFKEGLASFKMNDKWGYLNKAGEEIIPFQYGFVRDFSEGVAHAYESFEKEFYIDTKGNQLFEVQQYKEKKPCEEGLIMMRKGDKWGCLNKTGKEVIPFEYEDIAIRKNGFTAVKKNGKWGGINNEYQLIVAIEYENAMLFQEGLAGVILNNKWGFIDQTGKVVIPFQYDASWGGFKNGMATMELDGEKFEIDRTGKRKGGPAIVKKKVVIAPSTQKKPVINPLLTYTSFPTKGIGFGFPKGFNPSASNNENRMIFYKPDSSIIISVYSTSGFSINYITEEWETIYKTTQKEGWYKNLAKTAKKEYQHRKPVFTNDYLYPFTFGGGDLIWIQVMTTLKSAGLKEFEAVKASLDLKPMPVVESNVIPGVFTMVVPAYLKPATGSLYGNVSIFTDGYNFLYFKNNENTKAVSQLDAMLQYRDFRTRVGFKELGKINFLSPSKIGFVGFYGLESNALDASKKTYEGYAFFSKPGKANEIYILHYRLGKGTPKNMGLEMEEHMKNIRAK